MNTVLVVEDDHPTRERLCDAITAQPDLRVGFACDRVAPALAWLERNRPVVLLTDLGLPDGSGIDIIKHCSARYPGCNILVITMFGDEKNVLSSVEAGATGYILKDSEQLDVGRAMRELLAGGSPMSPVIARKVLNRARAFESGRAAELAGAGDSARAPGRAGAVTANTATNGTTAPGRQLLTGRETEALNLIARGYTYEETAQRLSVSLSTVQTYVRSIYGKLAVNSRGQAVIEAHRQGLLPDDLFRRS